MLFQTIVNFTITKAGRLDTKVFQKKNENLSPREISSLPIAEFTVRINILTARFIVVVVIVIIILI